MPENVAFSIKEEKVPKVVSLPCFIGFDRQLLVLRKVCVRLYACVR